MKRHIATGIDIGTHAVKVVIAEYVYDKESGTSKKRIIGIGGASSKGLRHGYIVDPHHVRECLREALTIAQDNANIEIQSAHLSIGGVSLEGLISKGAVSITRIDSELSDLDLNRVHEASKDALPNEARLNRRIIHTIPISYILDGKEVLGNPRGMKGSKLEVETLFVTTLEQHLEELVEAVEELGIEVEEVVASPIAAGVATLTKAQKIAGCVLANIGSETVSLVVYENDMPISLKVFPIGSNDITNDIALGLRIPIEEAETIKHHGVSRATHPQKKLDEIITARLKDIFELIETHLKKIGKNGLLPAGIILTGGGSALTSLEDLAKATLELPTQTSGITINTNARGNVTDASWTVAYGLALIGLSETSGRGKKFSTSLKSISNSGRIFGDIVKRFLP